MHHAHTPKPPELQFPVEWHGKIIAHDGEAVADALNRVLDERRLAQRVARGNASSGKRYVTYNVTVVFSDRKMMDDVTSALSRVDGVKLVL